MDSIIERIKSATDLAALIGQSFTISGRGRTLTTTEHDSLKIWTDSQTWHWFSQAVGGDCLDWYQHVHGCDLATAIDALATAAGIERRPLTAEEQAQRTHQQAHQRILALAAAHYHKQLLEHPAAEGARAYCASRGWNKETIVEQMIGCTLPLNQATDQPTSTDNKALSPDGRDEITPLQTTPLQTTPVQTTPLHTKLRAANLLHHPTARAVLSIPAEMVVYVHRRGGQVVYLSGRSISGKRHYNLPADLVGEKQPYHNSPYAYKAGPCLLVEGQADAISLAQLSIPAVALCGLAPGEAALGNITHIALDADEAGRKKALEIAQGRHPLLPIIEWQPMAGQPVKDANDALRAGAMTSDIVDLAERARPALLHLAERSRKLRGDARTEAQRQILDAYIGLDELEAADLRPEFAKSLGVSVAQLKNLLNARAKEREASNEAGEESESPDRYQNSAGGYHGGYLFEQCVEFNGEGRALAYFWVRLPDGKSERRPSVTVNGVCYLPYNPEDESIIKNRVILFPSACTPYGSESELFDATRSFLHRWVDVDPFFEQLSVYFVFFSWLYDCFQITPYLRALGDTGTGKSRLLKTVGALCFRPVFFDGATSEASIFRLIDMFKGTMVLDESDVANSSMSGLITKILNSGNSRYNNIVRTVPGADGKYHLEAYDVYCPKIIGGRAKFEDAAVESRCLVYQTSSRRPRAGIPRNFDAQFWEDATALRNKFLAYRFKHFRPDIDIPESLSDQSIEPRLDQVSMPIKAIISDPVMIEHLTTFMRLYNQRLINDRQLSTTSLVVQALAEIFYKPEQTTVGIVQDFSIKGIADRTQTLLNEFDPDERVNPRKIGAILANDLNLNDRTRDGAGRRCLVITEPLLEALMARFGVPKPV